MAVTNKLIPAGVHSKIVDSSVVTISDGSHGPMVLHKPDGTKLQGGDLVAGRVYEINITTGEVRWPPRNRKTRRTKTRRDNSA
jgi:hypothetical protein